MGPVFGKAADKLGLAKAAPPPMAAHPVSPLVDVGFDASGAFGGYGSLEGATAALGGYGMVGGGGSGYRGGGHGAAGMGDVGGPDADAGVVGF